MSAHSRIAATAFGLTMAGLVFGSIAVGITPHLPTVALGWVFGLQLLRAGVAFALVVAIAVLLVRGWNGQWPSRLSTTGVEFDDLGKATKGLEQGAELAIQVTRELARLQGEKP